MLLLFLVNQMIIGVEKKLIQITNFNLNEDADFSFKPIALLKIWMLQLLESERSLSIFQITKLYKINFNVPKVLSSKTYFNV
jgi:hypothetical protein